MTNQTTAKPRAIPPLIPVKSSSIQAIGHDGMALYVRFIKGSVYRYPGVTNAQYEELGKAESIGKHLQIHIMRKHEGMVVPEADGA